MQTTFTIKEREISLKKELKRVVSIVIRKYSPEKIILFGSLAKGKINEGSDIDFHYKRYRPKSWLKIAREDLKSARLLFKEGLFRMAGFLLSKPCLQHI